MEMSLCFKKESFYQFRGRKYRHIDRKYFSPSCNLPKYGPATGYWTCHLNILDTGKSASVKWKITDTGKDIFQVFIM